MKTEVVLELPHARGNPRNSEGGFAALSDGRIMLAYTRYVGRSWADEATAVIAARYSEDGGRTWSRRDRVLVENEGRCNVMSASLLRLSDGRLALFYLRKNGHADCRPYMRTSRDEGATWGRAILCIPAPGYFVVNNDRVIQLRGGRLVVPAGWHRTRSTAGGWGAMADSRAIAIFFRSDDGGATWAESKDWWALPVRSGSGLQEPGVVERADGSLYAWCRTDLGRQWEMTSADRGETWTAPRASRFLAPCAPLSIKRMPSTGDLLAVWNDHDPRWRTSRAWRAGAWGAKESWGRTPLVAAVSRDDGRTWRQRRLLEDDPARGFCYTAIHFAEDAVLLAYCCGGHGAAVLQDMRVRRIPLAWLYARV